MKKSFKKTIAVMIAVLMVITAIPFTAFAAPGDYKPDIQLQFGTFHSAVDDQWFDYSDNKDYDLSSSGIFGPALTYDYTIDKNPESQTYGDAIGTLRLEKDKANKAGEAVQTYVTNHSDEYDPFDLAPLTADHTYGVGDFFTATAVVTNIESLKSITAKIKYSNNIEPAGIVGVSRKSKPFASLSELSKYPGKEFEAGGTTFIEGQDIYALHSYFSGSAMLDDAHTSAIMTDKNTINLAFGGQNTSPAVKPEVVEKLVNPATGEKGYNSTDKFYVATFVFKIVADGNISFGITDKNAEEYGITDSTMLVVNGDDGTIGENLNTYAINKYNDKTQNNDGETEWPGSRKITFMGYNVYAPAETPTTYTIKFVRADGVDVPSQTVNAGEKPTVPDSNTAQTVKSDNAGHHTVTTYTWPTVEAATADRVYDEVPNPVKSDCHYTETVEQQPTYTEPGLMRYTCDVCGHSYTAEIPVKDCKHANTKLVNDSLPTINKAGYTGDTVCNDCGKTIKAGTEIAQLNGNDYRDALQAAQSKNAKDYTAESFAKVTEALAKYDEATVGAYTSQDDVNTATAALKAAVDGLKPVQTTETYTYNFINGESKERTVNKGETPENFANTPAKVTDNKNGTHTTTTYKWSQDGFVFTEVVDSNTEGKCTLNYETVIQPTIKVEGSKTATCPDCGYVSTLPIDKLDSTAYYAALRDAQNKNANDYTAASYAKVTAALKDYAEDVVATYTDPADVAKATKALEDAVTQLDPGVVVTVASTKLGTTTLNGADATNGANARLAVGDEVVLTAKANNETGEFVGWKVGNKIVSDEATFKTAATADITYEAVFAEKVDTSFTVVFVDPYGNVIDTQTVDSAADIKVPTEPVLPGYTFTGWSMTEEEISKLTDGATITAQYKKDDVAKYTVTVPEDATLTVDGVETASPAQVAYDAKVSVHKDGAQAWKLADGTVVGYGDTYTFFCGSNIELTAEMTAVEKKTTIVIVDAKQMKDSHKVIFNATRTVIPGETVVQQGFVYGKNLADSELTLENVGNKGAAANAGNVKVIYNKNSAEQIALSYGLTSQNGKISAVAFVITKNKQTGKLTPVYSNVMPFTYGA